MTYALDIREQTHCSFWIFDPGAVESDKRLHRRS